jgi:hypothetical protein
MPIGLKYITALLPAGAASMAIAVAPRALALPTTTVPPGSPAPQRTALDHGSDGRGHGGPYCAHYAAPTPRTNSTGSSAAGKPTLKIPLCVA